MTDINRVILIGRLTRDCEVKQLSNVAVCNFSIAVNRRTNQNGNWVDEPNFFDIELFGNLGIALQQYLLKGRQVAIEGSLRQARWETPEGQKRSRVSVTANNVQLVGGQRNDQNQQSSFNQGEPQGHSGNINPNGGVQSFNNNQFNNNQGMDFQNNQQAMQNDFQDDIPF